MTVDMFRPSALLAVILISLLSSTSSLKGDDCKTFEFSHGRSFTHCNNLGTFNASLHWSYHKPASVSSNATVLVDIAYRRASLFDRRWVAWAINPHSTAMIGSQALIAFSRTNGQVYAYTSPIRSYSTRLEQGSLSFPVHGVSATRTNNDIIIFATLELPLPRNSSSHVINHLWQEGPLDGDTPGMHSTSPSSPNMKSFGAIDLLSGTSSEGRSTKPSVKTVCKNAHAVLNVVSWGILTPIGAMIARHFRSYEPLWFYLHMSCQLSAFVLGTAGFLVGVFMAVKYGVPSSARIHMTIGIVMFGLAVAQVIVAVVARPKKDSTKRKYWNWFHYLTGYSTILLGVGNIIHVFYLLPGKTTWMTFYVSLIGTLFLAAVCFELRRCCTRSAKNGAGAVPAEA